MECQSRYFDYDDLTETVDETDEETDEESGSDSDSYTSEDHYVTNCYLIHTEELCECCQMQQKQSYRTTATTMTAANASTYAEIACNDLSFHNYLS